DAWEAIRAVKDALQYKNFEFRFVFKWGNGELLHYFGFQQNEFIEYTSPTYHTRFLSIEFVRHFGDALFTERATDENHGRRLMLTNGALRIKMNRLREAYNQLINPEPVMFPTAADLNVTPLQLPVDIDKPILAIRALQAGYANWYKEHSLPNTRLNIEPYELCLFLTLRKQLEPENLDLRYLATPDVGTYYPANWMVAAVLPDGEMVGSIVYGTQQLPSPLAPPKDSIYPYASWYVGSNGARWLVLHVPEEVYNLFPREQWLSVYDFQFG
ncbi:hypothetical protein PWL12_004923, partial [Salmonella enterica]|nr:hypothetical protein [Salmonella enterica]